MRDLAAPHLIDLEVTSVLRSALRAGRMTARRASQALQDLADLDIERVAHTALLARLWDLGDNYTTYDASYIALAELFQAVLLTYDAKMARGTGARCTFEVFPERSEVLAGSGGAGELAPLLGEVPGGSYSALRPEPADDNHRLHGWFSRSGA